MMRKLTSLVVTICLCLVASSRGDEKAIARADLVHASLVASVDAVAPGSTFQLGVRLKIAPHYHTYWVNPGEFGNPTRIKLTGPAGFEFGEIQWPLPTRIEHDGSVTFGYEKEVLLMVPAKVGGTVTGGVAKIVADVAWLSCNEVCVEGAARLEIELPIGPEALPANRELFETWNQRLPLSKDQAADVLSNAGQTQASDGTPMPALAIKWKVAPANVEWFPIATASIAIENIVVRTVGANTEISYKPTIYKPVQIPNERIDSVLVYQDAAGGRHGILIPIDVKKMNNAK